MPIFTYFRTCLDFKYLSKLYQSLFTGDLFLQEYLQREMDKLFTVKGQQLCVTYTLFLLNFKPVACSHIYCKKKIFLEA